MTPFKMPQASYIAQSEVRKAYMTILKGGTGADSDPPAWVAVPRGTPVEKKPPDVTLTVLVGWYYKFWIEFW
jgi:hypothetical protein